MAEGIDVALIDRGEGPTTGDAVFRVEIFDRDLWGHDAELSIIAEVEVNDGRAVNDSATLFTHSFRAASMAEEVRIPRDQLRVYSYSGRMIKVKLQTKLVVDDAILFDTKEVEEHELDLGDKPRTSALGTSVIDPKDAFDFFKNLQAIPADARAKTTMLAAAGAVVILVNTVVGLHDQFSPPGFTWFFSHVDSDGDPASPFFQSLAGSGAIGAGLWFLIRRQLRKYMEFALRVHGRLLRDRSYSVGDLVKGQSRVPLHDVKLRVVACNMECGQYRRGSGTDERTVSFREPVNPVVLYEHHAPYVPAHQPIAEYFGGEVRFEPMFAALYPPVEVSSTHGVGVHWEVQLLHPDFVDQELVGSSDVFDYEDFLEG